MPASLLQRLPCPLRPVLPTVSPSLFPPISLCLVSARGRLTLLQWGIVLVASKLFNVRNVKNRDKNKRKRKNTFYTYVSIVVVRQPSFHTLAILSSQLRHHIGRHHFTSSSALHQQSTLRTPAHASEVWRTFIFVCRTKSLEHSAIITA